MASPLQRVRQIVLESLYEAETSEHSIETAYDRAIASAAEEDEAVGAPGPSGFGKGILRKVWMNREELDAVIGEFAPRYPVSTMPVIDRNILRLAIWELRSDAKAPVAAVINEAVDLAHRYGGERSPAFIHGVLGAVSKSLSTPDIEGA